MLFRSFSLTSNVLFYFLFNDIWVTAPTHTHTALSALLLLLLFESTFFKFLLREEHMYSTSSSYCSPSPLKKKKVPLASLVFFWTSLFHLFFCLFV